MKKRSGIIVIIIAILVLSSFSSVATPKTTAQDITLTIWTDEQRLPILTELSQGFTEEYGVEVVVDIMGFGDMRDNIIRGASTGEGADLFILPHDNMGALVEAGAAAPIDLEDKADLFLPSALEAFTYNDVLYGVPIAVENIGFFRNTELVPDAPTTWAEVADIGKELVDSGEAEFAIALPDLGFNYYPVYTAFGGYIFGRGEDGNYNAEDLGMDSDGMIQGAEWANDLIRDGYASENLDWEAAHVLFETGGTPFIMTGPWAVGRFQEAGVPYEITAFPAAEEDGEPGAPFIGVQGFMVNANSDNVLLAQTYLLEFIATEEAMQYIFENDPRPSAWVSVFEATDDPDMTGFGLAGANAQPMPAIPAMGFVWESWDNAGLLLAQGELTPSDALTSAAEQIRTQINESEE
jgi:maltose/maltodextrin transport system substrate-binding protein/arabinogalactan oligomer/maltooligosaccharide transport system substrate-binding protein